MEESELISAVRASCGKVVDLKQIDNSDILREKDVILREIANWISEEVVRYIESTKDEREYAVHENTTRVKDVLPWDGVDEQQMILGTHRADETADASEYYISPSLWAIKMARKLRALPRLDWEFHPRTRKLYIDPAPREDGLRYYYISVENGNWTLLDLPDDLEEVLILGVTWKSLELIALARTNLGGISRGGDIISYPASELKREFVDSKKDEYKMKLRIMSNLYKM